MSPGLSLLVKIGIALVAMSLFIALLFRLAAREKRQLAAYYQDDARKPLDHSFLKTYGILRLDRADVENIIRMFQHASRYDLTLYIDRYRIHDIAEIVKIPKGKTEYLRVISHAPRAMLTFSKEKAELAIEDGDDPILLSLAREIDTLLIQRTTVPRPLPIKDRYIIVTGMVGFLITVDFFPFAGTIRSFLNHHRPIGIAYSVMFASNAVLLYYLLLHSYFAKRRHTTIVLSAPPSKLSAFWGKYQVTIFTAIIGIMTAITLARLHVSK